MSHKTGNRNEQKFHDENKKSNSSEVDADEKEALKALLHSAENRMKEKQVTLNQPSMSDIADYPKTKKAKYNHNVGKGITNARKSNDWGESDQSDGATQRKRWGKQPQQQNLSEFGSKKQEENQKVSKPKELANFGLSGALAKDTQTGNATYNGIVLKFSEPPEARTPNTRWRLYVFRDTELLQTLHISKQSAYLFGREKAVADILVEHPSLSRQHCVLQYRGITDPIDNTIVRCKPYIMDLGSANGTFVNGQKIEDSRYYELRKKDVITLGTSRREYVLLTENTSS